MVGDLKICVHREIIIGDKWNNGIGVAAVASRMNGEHW